MAPGMAAQILIYFLLHILSFFQCCYRQETQPSLSSLPQCRPGHAVQAPCTAPDPLALVAAGRGLVLVDEGRQLVQLGARHVRNLAGSEGERGSGTVIPRRQAASVTELETHSRHRCTQRFHECPELHPDSLGRGSTVR